MPVYITENGACFDDAVTDMTRLEAMLHYLVERATGPARKLGIEPRRVRVHIYWSDGKSSAQAERIAGSGCATESLFNTARDILRAIGTRRMGVRNVGVAISSFRLESRQQGSLFAAEPLRQGRLDSTVDEIRERFGFTSLLRGQSLELMGRMKMDKHGFILRTPCLTR